MAPKATDNPLLSTQKSSDSGLQIALHPLALLTISDYVTRHTLRNQKGPIVGALLGQQNGRQITIEHTFDVHMIQVDNEQKIHKAWFDDRLQHMKDVHKAPALDFVGWWTLLPTAGPQQVHLPLHREFLESYNESAILLGFHPTDVQSGTVGGKLPITIYESNYEAEGTTTTNGGGEDKEMKDIEIPLALRFKELQYTVETGEAEMISVDYIARGGGNATAVESGTKEKVKEDASVMGKGKGKAIKKSGEPEMVTSRSSLTAAEEEKIASLTARANAIRMLKSRIDLIAKYLQSLPPSFIDPNIPEETEEEKKKYMPVDYCVLRSIYALLNRLSLIEPTGAFQAELLSETNDVSLVNLLSNLTSSVKGIRETGRKYQIVNEGKTKGRGRTEDSQRWLESGGTITSVGDLIN
ncbi:putative COP9 signalosome subunit 6 [Bisporella sp. PMI_857]|nr:putative COP9 signalosome subunit 6 [Bisporella sp. PMI_857]